MALSRRSLLKGAAATAGASLLEHAGLSTALAGTELGPRIESQVWWRKDGILVPQAVGEHIHVEVEHPGDGVYDGKVTRTVRIRTHGLTGTEGVRFLRLQQADAAGQTEQLHVDFAKGQLVGGSDLTFQVEVDYSRWRTGRCEERWTANCPANGEGNRMYQSTGYQVTVRSDSPRYRTDPFIEARGWYASHGYANARWLTPLSGIKRGATVKVKIAPGSGGKTTKLAIVSANPNYHAGDGGTELLRKTAAGTYTVLIPSDLPDGSRLVAISSDGQVAGVSAVPVL